MSAGGKQNDSSMSDEEWEKFLRESMSGVGEAPREPSARDRANAARPVAEPGPATAWRTYTPPRPKRRKGWYAAVLLVAAALLAVALTSGRLGSLVGIGDKRTLAAETTAPTGAPPAEPALRATLAAPFRGSPAAHWAVGTAGITVPDAEAVGWMSKSQVAKALTQSRDFLAEANLDPGVLQGDYPKKAVALLNPRQKDTKELLKHAFRTPGQKYDPLLLFSRFPMMDVRLVGDEIRTRGRITFAEGKRGALQVTADVTFVYPVTTRAASAQEKVVRTIVRREVVMSWDDPDKVITKAGTFSLISYKLDMTNGGCGTLKGYFTPPLAPDRSPAPEGAGKDPYDRSGPVAEHSRPTDADCATATRS